MAIEIVHDSERDAWWVRKRDDENGKTIWHTEVYESKRHAQEIAEQEAGDSEITYVEESE